MRKELAAQNTQLRTQKIAPLCAVHASAGTHARPPCADCSLQQRFCFTALHQAGVIRAQSSAHRCGGAVSWTSNTKSVSVLAVLVPVYRSPPARYSGPVSPQIESDYRPQTARPAGRHQSCICGVRSYPICGPTEQLAVIKHRLFKHGKIHFIYI